MDIELIIVTLGYIGIFGLMISNGFFSIPSSQILYIITGYFIFTGDLNLYLAALAGATGNTIGNVLLYEAARSKGLKYILKFKMFREKEIRKVQAAFKKRGAWFILIGKLLPAIKVFVPIPAGIGKMNRALFTSIIFVASLFWSLIFISIGYFFGKSADVFQSYAIILAIVAVVVVTIFYKYINSEEVLREVEGLPKEEVEDTKDSR